MLQFNRLLFHCPNSTYKAEEFQNELIYIPRKDENGTIPCYWHPTPHKKIMVYFHGAGEDLGCCKNEIDAFKQMLEVSVLAMEYPGHGVHWDQGICTEHFLIDDAQHVLNFLTKELMISTKDIILFGRSMGGAIVN